MRNFAAQATYSVAISSYDICLGFGIAHVNALPDDTEGTILMAAFGLAAHSPMMRCRGSIIPTIAAHFLADLVVIGLLAA